MRRALPILAGSLLLGLLLPAAALAHLGSVAPAVELPPPSFEASTAVLRAAPAVAPPFALGLDVVAGALLAVAMRRRPRRLLVLALAVLIAVFAVEAGIHSVHHMGEHTAAACAVAAAASHLALCLDAGPPLVGPWLALAGAVAAAGLPSPTAAEPGPDLARAPPAPIA